MNRGKVMMIRCANQNAFHSEAAERIDNRSATFKPESYTLSAEKFPWTRGKKKKINSEPKYRIVNNFESSDSGNYR